MYGNRGRFHPQQSSRRAWWWSGGCQRGDHGLRENLGKDLQYLLLDVDMVCSDDTLTEVDRHVALNCEDKSYVPTEECPASDGGPRVVPQGPLCSALSRASSTSSEEGRRQNKSGRVIAGGRRHQCGCSECLWACYRLASTE